MPFLELFDETLDINSTENYELSVQADSDELSFCILDTLRNKFVLLRSYEAEENARFDPVSLSELITRDDFLTRHFKKIDIITPSFKSTLVPGPLFDGSRKDDYFRFNQIVSEDEKILVNKLRDPDIFLLFSLPEKFADTLNSSFPGTRFMHQLKPLFQYISFNRRSIGFNNVHVHLEGDYLTVVIFDQNTLKFCNTFPYRSVTDVQYYVLYVLKRMNISQEETVYFSGRNLTRKEVLNSFSNYLSAIRFAAPEGNFTLSYVFNEIEIHRYLTIFSAVNCE
jgi:hypothetical protein